MQGIVINLCYAFEVKVIILEIQNTSPTKPACGDIDFVLPYIANCSRWKSFVVFTD